MERKKVQKVFRSREEIVGLLNECSGSGMSIKAFCADRSICEGTFYHWRHKYGEDSNVEEKAGFSSLQINSSSLPGLFAEVRGIKIYQPVSAAYLKELLA